MPRSIASPPSRSATTCETDLSRRDFTINAMAVRLPDGGFVDPYGGVRHLAAKVLDTPLEPEVSFGDDPLRMLRAARFVSQLEVEPAPRVVAAIEAMVERMRIVSAERIAEELAKLLTGRARGHGPGAARRHEARRHLPAGARRPRARAGPGAPAQGRAAPHLCGRREHRARRGAAARRAACTTSASRRPARSRPTACSSTTMRSSARAWPTSACASCATRTTSSTTCASSSRCTCGSTGTATAGATRPCAATCAMRGRCSTS